MKSFTQIHKSFAQKHNLAIFRDKKKNPLGFLKKEKENLAGFHPAIVKYSTCRIEKWEKHLGNAFLFIS